LLSEVESLFHIGHPVLDANPPVERTTEATDPKDAALVAFFTYHAPTETDKVCYSAINDAALAFARVVMATTPSCPDQSAAIRLIREARMTANAAIACKGARLPY